jgi:hypothetical protein
MKRVIYYGIVKGDNDPAKLGRIRVFAEMDAIEEQLESIKIKARIFFIEYENENML